MEDDCTIEQGKYDIIPFLNKISLTLPATESMIMEKIARFNSGRDLFSGKNLQLEDAREWLKIRYGD